jgi:hypothetical protein
MERGMAFFAQIIRLFLWKRLEEQQKDIFCGTALAATTLPTGGMMRPVKPKS